MARAPSAAEAGRAASPIAFVHNFCTHYTVGTFERLARRHDVRFMFISPGGEWFWLPQHGVRTGAFQGEYLPEVRLGPFHLMPALLFRLWRGDFSLFVKSIGGRVAVPLTYLMARLRRRPFILWTGVWMRIGGLFHQLSFPVLRYIYRRSDAIVVYGEHVKRYLVSEGVQAERVFVAPHAVDNALYAKAVPPEETADLREKLGVPPKGKIVLFVGRLVPEKGLPHLIEAFSHLGNGDAWLVLAGEGSERRSLELLAERLGVRNVRFTGYVEIEDTIRYYAAAWVAVLPSITTRNFKEPWGLVVNEAFNQGLPVIATDAVGAAAGGLLENGLSGLVVPEGNPELLAAALRRVLGEDGVRGRMSDHARRKVAGWNQDGMVRGFEAAFQFVMRRG